MFSASDPRQPNRQGQPAPRPVQAGQRPAQPTQRAAQPVARPAQSSSRAAQPTQRAAQQSAARPAQPAGGARFKQQAPMQRAQAPQSHTHAHRSHDTHGVAPATRSSYNTHTRRGTKKKSSPVPMIIGAVVAVFALAAIAFFVVPAVKGFFAGEDTKVAAGQQVTITPALSSKRFVMRSETLSFIKTPLHIIEIRIADITFFSAGKFALNNIIIKDIPTTTNIVLKVIRTIQSIVNTNQTTSFFFLAINIL